MRQRDLIAGFLGSGRVVVFCGHLLHPWLPGCGTFVPAPVTSYRDYVVQHRRPPSRLRGGRPARPDLPAGRGRVLRPGPQPPASGRRGAGQAGRAGSRSPGSTGRPPGGRCSSTPATTSSASPTTPPPPGWARSSWTGSRGRRGGCRASGRAAGEDGARRLRRLGGAPPGPQRAEVREVAGRDRLPARPARGRSARARRPAGARAAPRRQAPGGPAPAARGAGPGADRRRVRRAVGVRRAPAGLAAGHRLDRQPHELLVVARPEATSGLHAHLPEHDLWRYLGLEDATWHHHGVLRAPEGAEVLVSPRQPDGGERCSTSTPSARRARLSSPPSTRCRTSAPTSCRPPSGSSTASCPGWPRASSRAATGPMR